MPPKSKKPAILPKLPKPGIEKIVYQEPIYDKTDPFGHYNALSNYHKKCIYATNFWRIANGMQPIPVPESNKAYWKCWTDYIQKQAEETATEIKRTKSKKE